MIINRALIAAHAILHTTKKNDINNKTILIVFQQLFGDSVIIQNSLTEYTKIFPKSEGYDVRFLVRPSVLSFMQATMPLPDDITFEAVDFKRFLVDFRYYKETVRKYRDVAGILVVPGTSFSAEVFAAASNAKRKIGLIRSFDVLKPWVMAYFYKVAYTERVKPEKEDMMLQRHRKLLNYLGDSTYEAKLPKLLPKPRMIEGRYAVICPGASKAEKCWPVERFAETADYLIEQYKLPVHLCGGAEEKKSANQMIQQMKHPDQITDHIGKTSFSEWSAIIQHADIVVGNDSATLHIAAAGRVKSVCIAGVYDKNQFFPYKADRLDDGDILPVTIMKDMPCEWCRTRGYDAGYGNPSCTARIKAGKCAECIDAITVEEVKTAIDKLLQESPK